MMESIEHEGETKCHSVTNMNCKQEGEVLDLDELGGSNPSSNALMVRLHNDPTEPLYPLLFIQMTLSGQFAWKSFFLNPFMLVF